MCFSQISAKISGGVTLAEIAEMYNQRELDEEGFKYAIEQFYEAHTDGSFLGWDSDQKREAQVVKEALTYGRTRAEAEAKKIAARAEANALAKTGGAKARSALDKQSYRRSFWCNFADFGCHWHSCQHLHDDHTICDREV